MSKTQILQPRGNTLLVDATRGGRPPREARFWLNSRTRQTAVQVADCSPSMSGEKIAAVNAGHRELVDEAARPENKSAIWLAAVGFSGRAWEIYEPSPAAQLAANPARIDVQGSSTNFRAATEAAISMARRAVAAPEVRHLKPVVVWWSDGQSNTGGDPLALRRELHEAATVVTVAIGADADEALLRALATSKQHHLRVNSGSELRSFLAAVGRTLTLTTASGTDFARTLQGQLG